MSMKTNERVKKSRVKSRESKVECDSKVGATWGVFLDSQLSTLDFGLSNLKERTGNVDENKRASEEVKSQESKVQSRMRQQSRRGLGRVSRLSTLDFGLSNLKEQTGNVDENKRSVWRTRPIPECLSARGHRVSDEVEQVKEQNEGRQSKADD